jgi:hypothetical protein
MCLSRSSSFTCPMDLRRALFSCSELYIEVIDELRLRKINVLLQINRVISFYYVSLKQSRKTSYVCSIEVYLTPV